MLAPTPTTPNLPTMPTEVRLLLTTARTHPRSNSPAWRGSSNGACPRPSAVMDPGSTEGTVDSSAGRLELVTGSTTPLALPLQRGYSSNSRGTPPTKRDFLRTLTAADAQVIKLRVRLDPGRFWRAAKGKEFIDLPTSPRQLTLFE